MVACGRCELHLHRLYFTLNFVILVAYVSLLEFCLSHLKHVEYFVSVTTHVNLNGEHILLPGKVEGSYLMIAWKAITMYIFSVVNNDHNNAHA